MDTSDQPRPDIWTKLIGLARAVDARSYYQLLGVTMDAAGEELRRRYLERTALIDAFPRASGAGRTHRNALLRLKARLREAYAPSHEGYCMHEFVLSASKQKARGVRALDIAKRILDFGMHAPTTYFPLIVDEALMVEPTETETKATLDAYADVLLAIDRESRENPERVKEAPTQTPVRRLDEARAARQLVLTWRDLEAEGAGA